jgi:FHA domain
MIVSGREKSCPANFRLSVRVMYYLKTEIGESRPKGLELISAHKYMLGTSLECQMLFEGEKISRCHAEITVTENGVSITDLSSFRTYVNGMKLPPSSCLPLWPGDRINLGGEAPVILFAGPPLDTCDSYVLLHAQPEFTLDVAYRRVSQRGFPIKDQLTSQEFEVLRILNNEPDPEKPHKVVSNKQILDELIRLELAVRDPEEPGALVTASYTGLGARSSVTPKSQH